MKKDQKSFCDSKMIILRPKNVIFERFRPLSKFYFPACSTLLMMKSEREMNQLIHTILVYTSNTECRKFRNQICFLKTEK